MMKRIFLTVIALIAVISANAQNDFQRTSKGTLYKIVKANPGEKIKLDQIITFNLVQKTDKDSVLASTYTIGRPFQARVQAEGDLMDVFPLLAEKDSAVVKVPADSIFKDNEDKRPPFFPKGSSLLMCLKIERVQTLEEAMAEREKAMEEERAAIAKMAEQEPAIAAAYITDNKLVLKTTTSGLKYVITEPSVKRKPLPGDTVYVNYLGRTLDGKVFDTSIEAEAEKAGIKQEGRPYEPISFILGRQEVIPGWDEGLQLLGEGSKATLIIPSKLAYADRGAGADIKPYSTLRFDVELVKVGPVKHVAPKKPVTKKPVTKAAAVKKPVAPVVKKAPAKKQ